MKLQLIFHVPSIERISIKLWILSKIPSKKNISSNRSFKRSRAKIRIHKCFGPIVLQKASGYLHYTLSLILLQITFGLSCCKLGFEMNIELFFCFVLLVVFLDGIHTYDFSDFYDNSIGKGPSIDILSQHIFGLLLAHPPTQPQFQILNASPAFSRLRYQWQWVGVWKFLWTRRTYRWEILVLHFRFLGFLWYQTTR